MKRGLYIPGLLVAALIVAVLALGGCGGSDNDNRYVNLGYVYGVKVVPADGIKGVDLEQDVYVSWPETNFPPPASFTFTLEEETSTGWAGVYTDDVGSSYVSGVETWHFRPVYQLTPRTWHRVTIVDDTARRQVSMFKSGGSVMINSKSADRSNSKGAIEHTIKVR